MWKTDFQGGSSEQLYKSVHSQIFTLPKSTLVYPAHEYKGFTASTVGEEMQYNTRLTKDEETFKNIMERKDVNKMAPTRRFSYEQCSTCCLRHNDETCTD